MSTSAALVSVLEDAQRLGMLGSRPVDQVIAHAHAFTVALPDVARRVIDLGAGGGVPGLVVALERPDLDLTLVDRRQKRTDFLERAVRRLELADRCRVWCRDVHDVVRDCGGGVPECSRWDAVISRGFGPPRLTMHFATQLVMSTGVIVISEPPAQYGDRWPVELLHELGVQRVVPCPGGVVVLRPVGQGRVSRMIR